MSMDNPCRSHKQEMYFYILEYYAEAYDYHHKVSAEIHCPAPIRSPINITLPWAAFYEKNLGQIGYKMTAPNK